MGTFELSACKNAGKLDLGAKQLPGLWLQLAPPSAAKASLGRSMEEDPCLHRYSILFAESYLPDSGAW